ncbi:MAG: ADP-ribosylglycohydrolase family protein [Flavobacterium sp.]|nr:ADP-ribosylglycohydrolase family protein [Flavobacterium sp.]
MKNIFSICISCLFLTTLFAQENKISNSNVKKEGFKISLAEYNDKVHAIWAGQIIATLMALPAEHSVASVKWIDHINPDLRSRVLDDDWYYEMIAVKGFEKYGPEMTAAQLGEMWRLNKCGSWGSSAEARKQLDKGIKSPLTGHPLYNRFWFTIGPQFSADVYGALSPGIPNVAAKMAREYGHVNGYAEGVDGAVFVATAISLGFMEKDTKTIVRKAASMIDEKSPYRQCLNMVIEMADKGSSAQDVLEAIEQRWHIEYPNTNNAVANGGIIAACLWFGEADFLKTVNLASRSLDFTDSDCNAANAIGVIMAMKGTEGIPKGLMEEIGDTIKGDKMGKVEFNPAINESISELGKRTAKIGEKIVLLNGGSKSGNMMLIPIEPIIPQAAELFSLADYTKTWNPSWQLVGAGFFGPKGGTYLDVNENILVTYPRDEVRRLNLNQTIKLEDQKQLTIKVASEIGKPWELIVYVDDEKLNTTVIESISESAKWQEVNVDLTKFQGQEVKIRLFQNVLIKGSNKQGGSAYWKSITIL